MSSNKQREFKLKNKLCDGCGKPNENGKYLCDECTEKKKQINRETRIYRKMNKLCTRCGKPNDNGKIDCDACLEKRRKQSKETRIYYKATGICTRCHKIETYGYSALCDECQASVREYSNTHIRDEKKYSRNKRIKCKEQGLCIYCKRKTATKGAYCIECYTKEKNRKAKSNSGNIPISERNSYGLCTYCCKELDTENYPERKICSSCYERRKIVFSNLKRGNEYWVKMNGAIFNKQKC